MTQNASAPGHPNLGRQVRRGMSWNAANLVVNKGVSILVRLLLARLLVPESFGLIAMVMVLLEMITIFVDFGLKNALVQRRRDETSSIRYDSVFWFLFFGGIGWTLLFVIVGIPLIVWLYSEPQLRPLALLMSPSILLLSFSILPEVRLTRTMRFKSIVLAEIVANVVASSAAIALAFAGAGVWALVAQQILTAAIRTQMLWLAARWRPRFRFSWVALRDIMGFGGWMLGVRISDHMRSNIDKIAAGVILGAYPLGIYTIALLFTEQLRSQFSLVINRVYLPVFSRLQNEPPMMAEHFYQAANRICVLIFPVAMIVFLFSGEIVGMTLGAEWGDAHSIVRILMMSVMIYALSGPSPEFLIAGRSPNIVFSTVLRNTLLISLPATFFLTIAYGLTGTAIAGVVSMLTLRIRLLRAALRIGKLSTRRLGIALLPGIFIGGMLFTLYVFISLQLERSDW